MLRPVPTPYVPDLRPPVAMPRAGRRWATLAFWEPLVRRGEESKATRRRVTLKSLRSVLHTGLPGVLGAMGAAENLTTSFYAMAGETPLRPVPPCVLRKAPEIFPRKSINSQRLWSGIYALLIELGCVHGRPGPCENAGTDCLKRRQNPCNPCG
jgi:hypothetical protein